MQNEISMKSDPEIQFQLPPENLATPGLYDSILKAYANDTEFHRENPVLFYPETDRVAIIIDPRYDKMMEAVIRNFMFFLNPKGWNLCIGSYEGHEAAIRADFPDAVFFKINPEMIYFDPSGNPNITIESYNKILLNKTFWKTIPVEHVLLFQKDCIMYRLFPPYFFLHFDYAGANYGNNQAPLYGGINGGFSLRKRSVMLECLENITFEKIREYAPTIPSENSDFTNEDVFYTFACEMLQKSVPDKVHRTFLAIETDVNDNTSVFHGWNKPYHSYDHAVMLLRGSPLFSRYIESLVEQSLENAHKNP